MAYQENSSQRRDAVHYDLKEHIGVLSIKDTGWAREVNIVSWNGAPAKVDIREWNPEHARMSKGITLFEEEAETLTKLLAKRYGLRLVGSEPAQREPAHRTFMTEESAWPLPEGQDENLSGMSEAAEAEEAAEEQYTTPMQPAPVSEVVAACVAECAARMDE